MDDSNLTKYKGIYNQIYNAAKRNRFYIDNHNQPWLFQVGDAYNVDNRLIVPSNQATTNLYNYTPHVNGNYNFWKIWQSWFTKNYPNGSIVKEQGSSAVWLIEDDRRRPFMTWTAFLSRYKAKNIITITHNDLMKYPIGISIQFENYSYLKDPNNNVYLLDNDELRKFESREVTRYFGVNPEEIIDINWEDYNYYKRGKDITMKSTYPSGAILTNNTNKEIYYVKNGFKYPILDINILKINFPDQIQTYVDNEELSTLETGNPVKFKDGTLVKQKNTPTIFIISEGKLCPIKNVNVFEQLKYNWQDVISVDKSLIEKYEIGNAIEIIPQNIDKNQLLKDQTSAKPL